MLRIDRFADRIVATREVPGRDVAWGELPPNCRPELRAALEAQGLHLYSHQAEMFARALDGENVVITTGTASGKTLGYLLPLLQRVLEEPEARAMLLFPTKALAQDQLRGILDHVAHLVGREVQAGVYDGDTPPLERKRVRDECNLILTNPDMLNAAYLPNHGRRGFSHVFRNLRYLVVDETHVYRGAFGSHMANVMRRLRRVCAHYGSKPQVLASSATIANPAELAERIFDVPFSHVDEDGSPSTPKTVHFWQPPLVDDNYRRGVVQEMAELVPTLVNGRKRTIAFCRSRKETEVVLKECRDALASVDGGHDESQLVAGYRGGYTPEERRQVERDLVSGKLIGVVSTNALELGIDIGGLEVVVQGGFPGTRASFWQQIGRAGRRQGESVAFVILRMSPIDQYVALDPDWLMTRRAEHAVVDRDNLMIQLAHVRAAAAELPLTLDDAALFPDLGEAVAVLEEAGELRRVYGTYHWCGSPHPAGEFSLRNIDPDRFKIVNRDTGMTLSEMDRPQTYHEAHPRAVYLHDGRQYLVEELDLVGRVATVVSVEQNYYTEPDVRTTIDVLNLQEECEVGRTHGWFGDVRVEDATVGYKMLEFHNHQNLGYEQLDEVLVTSLETEGAWLAVPANVLNALGGEAQDYLKGVLHGVLTCARMTTMAEGSDLRGTSFHYADEAGGRTRTSLILYDSHPGGLGFASKAFERLEGIMEGAIRLLERCRCKDGCPACVGDYQLDRALVTWAAKNIFHETAPPQGVKAVRRPPSTRVRSRFRWDEVVEKWPRIVANLPAGGEAGAAFLEKVDSVRTRGAVLQMEVATPGLARWINDDGASGRLARLLARAITVPDDFRVEAFVADGNAEESALKDKKLRRRFEDLTGEAP